MTVNAVNSVYLWCLIYLNLADHPPTKIRKSDKLFEFDFSAEEILKSYINDCFKINDKQMIQRPKEDEYVKFKNYGQKIKPAMIYAEFQGILLPEDNEKQNPDEYYTNKYKKTCYLQLWL